MFRLLLEAPVERCTFATAFWVSMLSAQETMAFLALPRKPFNVGLVDRRDGNDEVRTTIVRAAVARGKLYAIKLSSK